MKMIDEVALELEKHPSVRTYRKELQDHGFHARMENFMEKEVSKRIIASQDQELRAIFKDAANGQIREWQNSWPSKMGKRTVEKEKRRRTHSSH